MQGARGSVPPDPSLLLPGLSTTITGLRQAISALHTATQEVKRYMLDEASIIYECKTCHNMFRSLANLIAHKRSYCCHQYCKIQHVYTDKIGQDFAASQTIFIESEPVETVMPQPVGDGEQISPSLLALQDAALLKDMEVKPVVNRLLPPRKEGLLSVLDRLARRVEPSNRNHALLLEPLTENKNAIFQNLLDVRTIGQEYAELNKESEETILVGRDGQELPKGLPQEDSIRRPVSPSGSDNSKENDVREPRSKRIYPCPLCKQDFTKVSNVYKHLSRKHDKSEVEARKMKKKIRAGSKVVINKAGKQLKEKTFEAKVPAMTVQKVVEEIREEEEEEEAEETGERTPASAHQTPVYQVKKPFVSEAPLRFAMELGLVSRTGVGMQKVNRLNEVWETKEDQQAKKTKSRLERRLARKKEEEMDHDGSVGNTDDDDEDSEISFNLERLSPQAVPEKKAKMKLASTNHDRDLRCHICKKQFKTPTFLNQHYTSAHFRNQIMADFPEDMRKKKCSLCSANFENHARLIIHLGATHKVIYRYMPSEQLKVPTPRTSKLGRPTHCASHIEGTVAPAETTSTIKQEVDNLEPDPLSIQDEFF